MQTVIGLIGDTRKIDIDLLAGLEIIDRVTRITDPFKSANRSFHPDDTVVTVGRGENMVKIGGGNFAMLNADICERRLIQFDDVAKNVADADAIIVIGGISARLEGEGGDKADIELPEVQQRLIRAMKATGKPVVVVNCSGSAIAFGSIKDQYNALLQAWYPGQGGAQALAEVIFGDYNPGGKLPVTLYESTNDLPDFLDYSMENRTYRYFRGVPQYAFGYGLSYTTFEVGKGKISKKSMKADGSVTVTVPVKNTGDREGTETIQVYVKALDYAEAPIKDLRGFAKVNLKPGETAKAEIVLNGESFDTSMGFSPLDGLVMGTRAGSMDVSAATYVAQKEGMTLAELDNMLNKKAGVQGITGISSDMRDIDAAYDEGNERAIIARDMYANRIKKFIGEYAAEMGGVDLVIFTGGVGENSPEVREYALQGLEFMGLEFDAVRNRGKRGTDYEISAEGSRVKAAVVCTDEELVIAKDTFRLVK